MAIRFVFTDVDGVLTDGGVYYDDQGGEQKKFNTRDGAGFFAAQRAGIKVIVITGRECEATRKRMNELNAYALFQNVKRKGEFINNYMTENGILPEETAYIGDDLIDLPPMKICGFSACPSDACDEVRNIVDYISEVKGGNGAFRDIVKYIMSQEGIWEKTIDGMYEAGI